MSERSFIFADLSGFTAMTELHGDEDAAAIALKFAELARSSLTEECRLVKTIGDAVMIVSTSPRTALLVALTLRDKAAAEPLFPLVRTGVHHGPAVERDGDFFGASVNLAARIAAYARAGQVLCSSEVAAAAESTDGVDAVAIGEATFKNVSMPVRVFELVRRDERRERSAVDPVCRMRVDPSTSFARIRDGNDEHHFCSAACLSTFLSRASSTAPATATSQAKT